MTHCHGHAMKTDMSYMNDISHIKPQMNSSTSETEKNLFNILYLNRFNQKPHSNAVKRCCFNCNKHLCYVIKANQTKLDCLDIQIKLS